MGQKKQSAAKKTAPATGGALMGMRSGMKKLAGAKPGSKSKSQWTFPQVLLAVAGVALLLALVYAMRR
jgi:hypothetical protein